MDSTALRRDLRLVDAVAFIVGLLLAGILPPVTRSAPHSSRSPIPQSGRTYEYGNRVLSPRFGFALPTPAGLPLDPGAGVVHHPRLTRVGPPSPRRTNAYPKARRRLSEMPNRRTGPLHKAARCMGLVLGLLARPGIAIEPDDQPQQQEDRGPITCVVSHDGYDVHFTAYAQVSPGDGRPGEAKPPVPFCQDLPATGPMHLTLDLMNREARTQPVAVRVVREGDDDPQASVPKSLLLDVPSKIYPTGVVEAEVGLDKPGKYAVLVDFDKGAGRGQVRIPLRVAQSGRLRTMIGPLIGALLAALVAAWLAYRRFGKSET